MITRAYLHRSEARYGKGWDEDGAVLSISAILHYIHVRLFNIPLLLLLPPSALALQKGALLAASHIATAAVQLIPVVVILAAVIDAPLLLPPPWHAGGLRIARPLLTSK
jgi:hypothetical protein